MSQDDFDDAIEEEGGAGSPFDLKVLLMYGAWRSKHWIGLCALLGTVGGLVAAASMPNVYQSVGKLDYRPSAKEAMTESSVAGFEGFDARNVPGMSNELTLLDELEPYINVARDLGPAYILGTPDPTEDDEGAGIVTRLWHGFQKTMISMTHPGYSTNDEVTEKAIRGAAQSLKARTKLLVPPRSQTSIIRVEHDGYSPERARRTNEAILKALQEYHLQLYTTDRLGEAAKANLAKVESEISTTDQQLQQHTQTCGYKNIEAQRDNHLQQIGEDRKIVAGLETEIAGLVRRLAQLDKDLLEVDPIRIVVTPPVMGLSGEYKFEQEILLNMKRDLAELEGNSTSKAMLENMRSRIKQQELKLESVPKHEEVEPPKRTSVPNDFYTELFTRRAETLADMEYKRGTVEELRIHIRDSEDHIRNMDDCRELHREKTTYLAMKYEERDFARKKLQATQDQESLEREGISALHQRGEASTPSMKTGPKRAKPLGMGIMGGLALGLFLAVLRQLLDPTVRYRETVEKELDLPILAVVPESRALRRIKPGHVNVA